MYAQMIPPLAAASPHPDSGNALWLLLLLAVIGYVLAYRISIRLHPYRPCRSCGESSKHRGTVFRRSFRPCGRCNGTGRELRPGAKKP